MLRRLVFLLALLVVLSPRVASADEAAARAHFKKAIDHYDKKRFAEALTEFEAAYREKPSPGIKQNIALSLKALERPADAATAFDEAIDEGKDSLKPETRGAIERELAELSNVVATVKLAVLGDDKQPLESAVISVRSGDKTRALPPGAQRRPLRLAPGVYIFGVHADGFIDPPEKKLALVAGAPIDATFVLVNTATAAGMLTVNSNVQDASIRIDGVEVARGAYSGKVAAGARKVEVSAPGRKTTTADVTVPAGGAVDLPVTLQAIGDAPAEYIAPPLKPIKNKRAYVAVTGALEGASYRLSAALAEPAPNGTRRAVGGLALGARGGYKLSPVFAIEGVVEVGGNAATYKLQPNDPNDSRVAVVHWHAAPQLRLSTPGKVRFTGAMGFGVHGLVVDADIDSPGLSRSRRGAGVGFVWLADAGLQLDAGPVFVEAVLFLAVHGTGAPREEDPPEDRLLLASPAVRAGFRLGLGIPF